MAFRSMSGVEQLLQCTASHSTLIPGYSCPSLQQKMDDGRRSRSRSPLRILITAQHDSQHITSVRVENGYYATTSTTTVWRHDPTWAAGRAPTVPTVRVSRGGGGEDGDDRDAGASRGGINREEEDAVYVGAPRWRDGVLHRQDHPLPVRARPAEIREEHARVGEVVLRRRPAAGGSGTKTKVTQK